MPFKSEKVKYGVPSVYEPEVTKSLCELLYAALDLKRLPVGVKLLFNEESYKAIPWDEPNGEQAYCCMIEKATRGKSMKTNLVHHNCDGGTTALYLEESTQKIESGEEYFSYNLYQTPAAARRIREGVKGLYRTQAKTYGLAIAPLEDFEQVPDVVIFMVNPYQAMRIQQGYVYADGSRIETSGASMQALCSEATVEPYLTGRLNSTPLCPSTRFLAKWHDDEMAIGIPFEKIESMVEGLMATIGTTDSEAKKTLISERLAALGKSL